jgi:hypothetical protein
MPVGKLNEFNSSTEVFESWVGVLDNYLIANDIDKTDTKTTGAAKAIAIFLSSVGVSNYRLMQDLVSPKKPEEKTFDELVKVLKDHFKPAPKAISERYKFYSRKQQPGESVIVYLSELRRLAVTCKFKDLDVSLRDQFVCGLLSETTMKRLFIEPDDLKLANAVSIATSQEAAEKSTQLIRNNSGPTSDSVESTNKVKNFKSKKPTTNPSGNSSQSSSTCPNCGGKHSRKDCPHKDIECHKCKKRGHFAKFCRGSRTSSGEKSYSNNKKVSSVCQVNSRESPIIIDLSLNGQQHSMELDTASGKSFVTPAMWKRLGSPKLKRSDIVFRTYTGQKFEAKGTFKCTITYNGQTVTHNMHVAEGSSLFGRDLLNVLQMDWGHIKSQCSQINKVKDSLSLKSLLEEYKDVFDDPVGLIRNFKAKLVLKDDASPRFIKARKVPFALREKVNFELDRMEKSGVIERIDHSDWASPLVIVPKPNGRVRITGDFKSTVNNQLCVKQYPLAHVDDLLESVSGGDTFSKLDGPDAFHQVEVEESCKRYLVVSTHRGLYRYNVLPQGIASSPAIFQELMDSMLQGIPMSGSFIDDVVTSGRDDDDHLQHLKQTFDKMRASNYRLSRSKCVFMQKKITFLGQDISKDGIRTNPLKVEAIMSMRKPRDVTEVQSFLGIVNFYAKFCPNLSHIAEPLNNLTRDKVKWEWSKSCQSAFDSIKKCVSSSPVLAHFDQSLPVGIACDASSVGLGVVLFHKYPDGSERPIAYASKTLSSAERNYSQIEKEGLAIVFGVRRFTQFLYGRRFILVTDHNPLLAIFGQNKQLPSLAATRLHRWSLFLSGYIYDIVYRKSSSHGNADALSRLPLHNSTCTDSEGDTNVRAVMEENPITSKVVRFRSSRDKTLCLVMKYIRQGWPSKQQQVPEEVRPYFHHRAEYSINQGIILWGLRVVVPACLQSSVLSQLHDTHPGVVRMKSLARQHVWWPGIDQGIEQVAKSCVDCAAHRQNPAVAPLHPWSFPEQPWQRIHMDLAGPFLNSMWLIVVDAHSKWPEVVRLGNDTTSAKIINSVREMFSRWGLPETLVTDNGPQFVSKEFEMFCKKNGVRHTTSCSRSTLTGSHLYVNSAMVSPFGSSRFRRMLRSGLSER